MDEADDGSKPLLTIDDNTDVSGILEALADENLGYGLTADYRIH